MATRQGIGAHTRHGPQTALLSEERAERDSFTLDRGPGQTLCLSLQGTTNRSKDGASLEP